MKYEEVLALSTQARAAGREVVAVVGLGFVGTAVVANLARAGERGLFLVVGIEQDTPDGRDKVASLDRGSPPSFADDPALVTTLRASIEEPRNVCGTVDSRALGLADVIVVCINLDVVRDAGQTEKLRVPIELYDAAMHNIGAHARPGALVCIESTLPLGASDRVLYPALCRGAKSRGGEPPLYAYCYERVMPGPGYLDSVNSFWRSFAGIDRKSAQRARAFLSKYVDVEHFPLWEHKTIRAAEMAKLLENSYRATNIAFIEEWARLAELAGVDLFDVVASIRVRKGTHDNMMLPGLGVGGYCLTKDALLAAYGAETLLGVDAALPFSRRAILTNERMPERAVWLAERHFGGALAGRRAVLLGVTYRPGVADTRSSPTEILARALVARGVLVSAFDPLLETWAEMPEIVLCATAESALRGADLVVVCLPDKHYAVALPDQLVHELGRGALVIDPWNIVADACASRLALRGVALEVFGRGDMPLGAGVNS
jgi:UDP-N-acetyl-D-glucosamine dehydrogenase